MPNKLLAPLQKFYFIHFAIFSENQYFILKATLKTQKKFIC